MRACISKGLFAALCGALLVTGCAMVKVRGVYHTVESGQTLWRICRGYGVELQEVAELNNIEDATKIWAGQKVFIPGAAEKKKIVPHDSRDSRAQPGPKKVALFRGRFSWPVKGKVISGYGMRDGGLHEGIDIKAPRGTQVRASADGKVVYSDSGMRGYGNVIIIEHPANFFSVYAHNEKNLVKNGARVKRGAVIARVGSSGNATTSQLHFEVRERKKTRNPLFFLP